MKRATVIGALVATALVAICALGTASASAVFFSTLCKTEVEFCSKENRLPAGSTLQTRSTSYGPKAISIYHTANEDHQLQCGENAMDFTATQVKGHPLPATFSGSINASECKMGFYNGTTCSNASISATSADLYAIGGVDGIAKIWGLTMSFTCNWKVLGYEGWESCTYAAKGPAEMEIGPGQGVAVLSEVPLAQTSGPEWFCGEGNEFLELTVVNVRPWSNKVYLSYYF